MVRHLCSRLTLCAALFYSVSMPIAAHASDFTARHETVLKADGPDQGLNSYALIRQAFGKKSIESPGLYPSNHFDVPHILEDTDEIVGPHFVFLAHRDEDHDRNKGATDRQRNEIKAYDKSDRNLLAYKNDIMQYRWKFKIEDDFEVSKSFTHFFQIKAKNTKGRGKKNGGDQYPVLTLSGVDRGSAGNQFQLRYSPGLGPNGEKARSEKLIREDMSRFTGQWIEFFMQIDFREDGNFDFTAKNIETGEQLVDYQKDNVDMWRGENKRDFSRPKWGVYRSLKDKDSLRAEEERVRFADLSIAKGRIE